MRLKRTIGFIIFFGFLALIYTNIMAFMDGIVGLTKKNGNTIGCVCHDFKPNDTVSVILSGPSVVQAGDTAIYQLKISNGPAIVGGCDISTSLGTIYTSVLDSNLKREEPVTGAGFELTHKHPVLFQNDTATFTFQYVAPLTPNVTDTLFANGNSANQDSTSENDKWNYAENFIITVTPVMSAGNSGTLVNSFELHQNYPNPFNPETKITFNVSKSSNIELSVYNISGKEIAKLIDNKFYNSGSYSVTFNAYQFNLTSGIYFYRLSDGNLSEVKSMTLVK